MPINIQDLLGGLADAFLIQSGNKPMYQDIRDTRELGNINLDLENDPMGTINRIHKVDPKLAEQYYQNQGLRDYRNTMAQVAGQRASTANTKADTDQERKFRGTIASRITAYTKAGDLENLDKYQRFAREVAASRGWNLDDMPDPKDIPGLMSWATGDITTKDQAKFDKDQQKIDELKNWHAETLPIQQQNANSNAVRAGASATSAGAAVQRAGDNHAVNFDANGQPIRMDNPNRRGSGGNVFKSGSGGQAPTSPKPYRVINGKIQKLQQDGSYR